MRLRLFMIKLSQVKIPFSWSLILTLNLGILIYKLYVIKIYILNQIGTHCRFSWDYNDKIRKIYGMSLK